MEEKVSPMIKTLARLVTKEEINYISGAGGGTVVKVGTPSPTQENTYDKNSEYMGKDTIGN